MRRRLRRDIASALNAAAHKEAHRKYVALSAELKTRAMELMDAGMPLHRLFETIRGEFGLEGLPIQGLE